MSNSGCLRASRRTLRRLIGPKNGDDSLQRICPISEDLKEKRMTYPAVSIALEPRACQADSLGPWDIRFAHPFAPGRSRRPARHPGPAESMEEARRGICFARFCRGPPRPDTLFLEFQERVSSTGCRVERVAGGRSFERIPPAAMES
jgi:hypothetical protein